MGTILIYFAIFMLIAVVGLIINEKTIKIPPEIALLILALIIGCVFKVLVNTGVFSPGGTILENFANIRLDEILLDVLLCFMLFSGASDLKFASLKKLAAPIALFALLTTIVTTLIYAGLLYLGSSLIGVSLSFDICLLIGAIISPTDPIAATGILSKLGLPKDVVAVMEGESLFNDGTGVAIFVFVKGLVTKSSDIGFFALMAKEIFGAIIIGLAVSFVCMLIVKRTKNQVNQIVISLLAVASCYSICELLGCSGVIASVICGIYFATCMEKLRDSGHVDPGEKVYENFWSSIDKLLNYILYIVIGLSFIFVVRIEYFLIALILAIVINFIARYGGVFFSSLFLRKLPGGYKKAPFSLLMTWSGLKGGLCLALCMSTAGILSGEVYNVALYFVFITIIFTTLVQGLTVGKLYMHMKKPAPIEGTT